eukprot:163817-Chlamydomonas_euryale.AAC.2
MSPARSVGCVSAYTAIAWPASVPATDHVRLVSTTTAGRPAWPASVPATACVCLLSTATAGLLCIATAGGPASSASLPSTPAKTSSGPTAGGTAPPALPATERASSNSPYCRWNGVASFCARNSACESALTDGNAPFEGSAPPPAACTDSPAATAVAE